MNPPDVTTKPDDAPEAVTTDALADKTPTPPRDRDHFGARLGRAIRSEWREIGILGRVAFLGVLLSLVVAVALGFWIPRIATHHILDARAELMVSIGNEIADEGLFPFGPPGTASYEAFETAIERRVLGGETIRVKMWSPDGRILFSDAPELVGGRFELSEPARAALSGDAQFNVSNLDDPAHAAERDLGELIEFYVPIRSPEGQALGLLEVEQSVDELNATRGHIQGSVWIAITTGIGLLGLFMAILTVQTARKLNRRRREAEILLGALFTSQEEERRRTVGALHDDVGQPLYRLLYGLQGTRAKVRDNPEAAEELDRLEGIVRDVDRTLRAELRLLHRGVNDDLDLHAAVEDLANLTERETALRIDVDVEPGDRTSISDVGRIALVHAAREALMNVRKHARASHVVVSAGPRSGRMVLRVEDDGSGWRGRQGLGLITLRERLEAIGGGLDVAGRRGRGTIVTAWVPTITDDR